jgi:hypothetical protein
MPLRDRIKRLERATEGEMIVIPQRDGTVRRFPASASADAYLNLCDRLGAGEDPRPSTRSSRLPGTLVMRGGRNPFTPRTPTSGHSR